MASRGHARTRDPARGQAPASHQAGPSREPPAEAPQAKSGKKRTLIDLLSNLFCISPEPSLLCQYQVDFQTPMESCHLRSTLLFQHEQDLGSAHCFDGVILFLPRRLPEQVTVLTSTTGNGEEVQITVTFTKELPPKSPECLQLYNILFRRILKILGMEQIGHNYYNTKDEQDLKICKIWPGYTTAILQCESIMLCIDVCHMVVRVETVLNFIVNLRQKCGHHSFTEICARELVGLIVVTKYNKIYRIDDIAWDQTPNNTFTLGDTDISFKNYYKNKYDLKIKDDNQVLLIGNEMSVRPSQAPGEPVMLIPELCCLTGLTDQMRSDDTIMTHINLPPEERAQHLYSFSNRIQESKKCLSTAPPLHHLTSVWYGRPWVMLLTMVRSSRSDEIYSANNHLHDVVHFQGLATQCLLVQNTVKCPETISSIKGLYFLSELCRDTGFLSYHGWCAVCSQADSTGPVHSNSVQCSNDRAENVFGCCGVHHWHQLKKFFSNSQCLINSTNK
ncbi:piwi-like protein 1 isoform X2 [Dunckerocampus dactyliophorus]|uniref:piwi-like protein 1 isoform X2 n=1 Tax=Dunckerocampus dactyliophorus TaxID=161453 RepID=UPI00240734ED|nr:piwi-like protein 1 isoform X2 [Dunckerocampus dactyliophorus]